MKCLYDFFRIKSLKHTYGSPIIHRQLDPTVKVSVDDEGILKLQLLDAVSFRDNPAEQSILILDMPLLV